MGKPRKKKSSQQQKKKKRTVQLLNKVYYSPEHAAALGGVDKLARAVRSQGIRQKDVEEWIRTQPAYTLHKPYKRRFPRSRVVVQGMDEQWQADLCDMQSLKSYNNNSHCRATN